MSLQQPPQTDPVVNAFSVDLEDWFQAVTSLNAHPERWCRYEPRVRTNTLRLLDLFEEYHIRATFFVLGAVAIQYPDLIRRIDAAGHEIGIHGHRHTRIHKLTPESFAAELDQALEAVLPLVSQPVIGHRAPYFSIDRETLWALDILREKGFQYDSSFFSTRNVLYGYPGSPGYPHRPGGDGLIEFPMATFQWADFTWPVAGGFYLRLFPYGYTRSGLRRINRTGQPAVLYLHPWELDAAHRYNQVTPREWIVQYTGRRTTEAKLRRLFGEFRFGPVRSLLETAFIHHDSVELEAA